MGGTIKYRCCRTTLDWNLGLSHASRQYGSSLLMLQPCRRNVGLAGFCIGTSEDDGHADDLPTLGKQRWKDIVFGKALTTGLWRLLSMVIGCGSKRILCFSRCTLVDRVRSCISFACALKGLPSGRQALTLTWLNLLKSITNIHTIINSWIRFPDFRAFSTKWNHLGFLFSLIHRRLHISKILKNHVSPVNL